MQKEDAISAFLVGEEWLGKKKDARRRPFTISLMLQTWQALASGDHLLGSSAIHIGLIEHDVRAHMCRPGGEHLLLTINQIAGVERGQLKAVTMRDGIGGAGLNAVAAENTSIVIDVVNLGVSFGATDALFRGVIGGFDINAVRWTIGGAKEASHTLFQSIFVALQNMGAAETGLNTCPAERTFSIRIILNGRGLEHLHEGDAHPLGDGGNIFQD